MANITTTTMAVARASTASSLLFRTFDQVRQPFVLDQFHQVAVIVAKDYVDTNSPVKWVKPNPWQRKTAQVSYVLPCPIWATIANAQELDIDGCTVHLHSIICQESFQLSWHRKGVPLPSVRFTNLFRKFRRLRNHCPQEDVLHIIRSLSYIMWDK